MTKSKAMIAVGMVALMFLAGLTMVPIRAADATVGDGGTYTYTLTYDSSQMSVDWSTSTALSVADMDAIFQPSYDSSTGTTTGYGDWTWDATTGVGPFNSFYAAFDINNGNAFVAVMDPFDLTHGIDGTDYTSQLSDLNIMWVLPTVYWKTDATHVYLTNNPGSDTDYKAYAHTFTMDDGTTHTYNYIAIGVYEGYRAGASSDYHLVSTSGTTPTANVIRSDLRTAAHNYTMSSTLANDPDYPAESMLWSYYQWEIYKYCCHVVLENFNSQNTVGNGSVMAWSVTTGATNSMGPYAGNPGIITDQTTSTTYGSDSVKLFIENMWGGLDEMVDGVVVNARSGIYVDTKLIPDDSTSGNGVTYYTISMTDMWGGFATSIRTSADQFWGFPAYINGTSSTGTCDRLYAGENVGNNFCVGGHSSVYSTALNAGVNALEMTGNNATSYYGSRLAFVFDANPLTTTVTLTTDGSGYGSLDGTTSFTVDPGSTITISGDTVTIGTDDVTAEPLSNTAQYSYDFVNWTVGGVAVTGSYTVNADTTLVANFSRTTNTYAVTITAGEGGTISDESIANVPYGTTWSTSGDTLTIGSDTVTATPNAATAQYTYAVDAWSPASGTVEGATSISVSFTATVNSYTITYVVSGVSTSETLDYGAMPAPEDPVAPEGYRFYGWNPALATVTADATYTAVFVELQDVVIVLDANGGASSVSSITVTYGDPLGDLPTPTRTGFDFLGWFTAAEGGAQVTSETIATEDMTIFAHWEITSTWNTYKILVYAMITLLFVGIAVAILRNYVGGDRF